MAHSKILLVMGGDPKIRKNRHNMVMVLYYVSSDKNATG